MHYYWTDCDSPSVAPDESPRAVYRTEQDAADLAFKENETFESVDVPTRCIVKSGTLPAWATSVVEANGTVRRLLQGEELEEAAAEEMLVDVRTSNDDEDDERGRLFYDTATEEICVHSTSGVWNLRFVPPSEVSPADLDAEPDSTKPPRRACYEV